MNDVGAWFDSVDSEANEGELWKIYSLAGHVTLNRNIIGEVSVGYVLCLRFASLETKVVEYECGSAKSTIGAPISVLEVVRNSNEPCLLELDMWEPLWWQGEQYYHLAAPLADRSCDTLATIWRSDSGFLALLVFPIVLKLDPVCP